MAIGAGDWPESFAAWGTTFPPGEQRIAQLEEAIDALKKLWTGQPVSQVGAHLRLDGAISTPSPARPPRIVIGVGRSRRVLARAVSFADEINLYDDAELIRQARELVASAARTISLSVFLSWEWENWPPDPEAEFARLAADGVDRAFVTVAAPDMIGRVERLAMLTDH